MASNLRKIKRDAAKKLYKEFCKNWTNTIVEQNELDNQSNRFRINERRRARYSERGKPILGRRPTFNEWWEACKTTTQAKDATPEQVQEHIEDLSWDDE